MQALTAVEWLTAVRYETDGRLANGWTDGLPENRLTGLGAGLPGRFAVDIPPQMGSWMLYLQNRMTVLEPVEMNVEMNVAGAAVAKHLSV